VAFHRPLHCSDFPEVSRSSGNLTIVASHAVVDRTKRPFHSNTVRSAIANAFSSNFDPQRLLLCTLGSDPSTSTEPITIEDSCKSTRREPPATHFSKHNDTLIVLTQDHYQRLIFADRSVLVRHYKNIENLLMFLQENSTQTICCRWPTTAKPQLELLS
jgi:hypothetical protein